MSEVKRYYLEHTDRIGDVYEAEAKEDKDGDWVSYSDFLALQRECEKWKREALQQYPTPEAYQAACDALNKCKEERDQAHNAAIQSAEMICFQVAKKYGDDSEDGDMEMLDAPACECMTEIRKLKRPA